MTYLGSFQIDPKDYPFKKFIDEQKHLDTDELRRMIKPIYHKIDEDFKGQEQVFCDKSQRDAEGKFRRPKKLVEAERRGFKSTMEMVDADKKAEEAAVAAAAAATQSTITTQANQISDLQAQLAALAAQMQTLLGSK